MVPGLGVIYVYTLTGTFSVVVVICYRFLLIKRKGTKKIPFGHTITAESPKLRKGRLLRGQKGG